MMTSTPYDSPEPYYSHAETVYASQHHLQQSQLSRQRSSSSESLAPSAKRPRALQPSTTYADLSASALVSRHRHEKQEQMQICERKSQEQHESSPSLPSTPPSAAPTETSTPPCIESAPQSVLSQAARPDGPVRSISLPIAFKKRPDLMARASAIASKVADQISFGEEYEAAARENGAILVGGIEGEQALRRRLTDPGFLGPLEDKVSEEERKAHDLMASALIGSSVVALEAIWGESPAFQTCFSQKPAILPLAWFVREVLRRSLTSRPTLELALYYLHKSRHNIRYAIELAETTREEWVKLEDAARRVEMGDVWPSAKQLNAASGSSSTAASDEGRFQALHEAQTTPLLCGRRSFLAALMSASKYLQDRNFSNRAWAKLSGLDVKEVGVNERAFLKMINHELHVPKETYFEWTKRLETLHRKGQDVDLAANTEEVIQAAAKVGLYRAEDQPPLGREDLVDTCLNARSTTAVFSNVDTGSSSIIAPPTASTLSLPSSLSKSIVLGDGAESRFADTPTAIAIDREDEENLLKKALTTAYAHHAQLAAVTAPPTPIMTIPTMSLTSPTSASTSMSSTSFNSMRMHCRPTTTTTRRIESSYMMSSRPMPPICV